MLNNRILVIGLERRYLDVLSQMKSEFIFISIDHPSKYRSEIHQLEGLIFRDQLLMSMGDIISHYRSRPIFGIGVGPVLPGITWLNPIPTPESLETILISSLGNVRLPPENTGRIEVGTLVKNKTFASWGIGVVKTHMGDDLFMISFPQAFKITKKETHICHKSTLRIIGNIKELTNETNK